VTARIELASGSRIDQQTFVSGTIEGLAIDQGNLYVLDGQASQLHLLRYPAAATSLSDPPQLLTSAAAALPLDHLSAFLPMTDLFLLDDDGHMLRYDRDGTSLPFEVRTPDGWSGPIAAAAPDGLGGLYLADANGARVVQTGDDGSFVRQLRSSSLDGVRVLHGSGDGRVLYGVSHDGIIAIDIPSL